MIIKREEALQSVSQVKAELIKKHGGLDWSFMDDTLNNILMLEQGEVNFDYIIAHLIEKSREVATHEAYGRLMRNMEQSTKESQ